ncbi:MAG: hypothetical protein HY647_05845, partial [Acidobacteria bacterium]|nr:hypothetical protein [Acidobacteriota bacterium]
MRRQERQTYNIMSGSQGCIGGKRSRGILSIVCFLCFVCFRSSTFAQTPALVQISDTLYNADGTKASGRLVVSWDYFTAADGTTVDGGALTYIIAATGLNAGKVEVSLAPNAGSSPAGTSYQARYILANGADYTETWVVPASGPVTIADIRASTVPSPTITFNPTTQLFLGGGAQGDLIVGSATAGYFARLARGTNGQCLTVTAATVAWGSCATGSGITSLNGLLDPTQTFATGTAGTDFGISSSGTTHTFNLPTASASNRGLLLAADWSAFNAKESALTFNSPLSRSGNSVSLGTVPETLGGTNQTSYTLGDLLYSDATNTLAKLAGNTTATKKFLTQTGNGTISAAPAWGAIAAGDLPAHAHAESDVTNLVSDLAAKEATANKNQASGYAGLDAGGLLAASQIPLPSATTLGGVKSLTCTGTDKLSALGTDGVPVCSADQSGGSSHNLLSATHPDTTTASPTRGDIITAQGVSPTWSRFAKGTQYQTLQAGASEPAYDAVHLDQSPAVTGVLGSANGGTGNGFTKFSGPASTEKTFTLPNASATILTTNTAVTVAQGGTGAATLTGVLIGNGTSAVTATTILGSANGGTGNGFSKFSGPTTSEKTFTLPDASATILTTNAAVTPTQGGTGQSTTATTGRYLKGDGTNWGTSSGPASGTGACSANTWASTLNSDATPTCTQPDFSNLSGTVGDTQIAAGAVDGGSGGEIADGTVDSNDLATANKTITKSVNIFSPVTSDTNLIQFYWPAAVTLQRIACSTDTGTVSINFDERAEATPNT